ncbi:MAG: hypothetical protein HQ500_06095 [Flavobacteriales bacterium]|nr:hypothetical protein [Flavobacteriales bacterium]
MTTQDSMTNEQRLTLITDMINKARFNFSRGSFYFILWGAILFGAAVYEYIAGSVFDLAMPWIGWPIAGILGGGFSAVYSRKEYSDGPSTHLDKIYSSIWMVYFVTLIMLVVAWVSNHISPGSYIMIITGFPTFLTGYILKFKPLQWGGIAFWVLGLLSLYFMHDYSSLIFALSMVLGYVIPGFMMRSMQS